ncbi:MAG: diguanylate cyclase [Thiohalomonadales bacterium]
MRNKKFGLPHKSIMLGFITSGVLVTALFLLITASMETIHQDIKVIVNENNASIALATRMRDIIHKRQISLRNVFIYSDYFARDDEKLLFYSYAQQYIETRDELAVFLKTSEEKVIFAEIKALSAIAYPLQNNLVEQAMTDIPISEIEKQLQTTLSQQSNVIQLLTRLLDYEQAAAELNLQQASETYESTRIIILALGGVTALLITMIAIQVTRRTKVQTRRIRDLSKMPIESPMPVIRVHIDGTILFVNEASYCLLDDWGCNLGEKIPTKWQAVINSLNGQERKIEITISCQDKIFALTITGFARENYVNFYGKDITESENLKQKIAFQASHDSLTGLINRREFETRLNQLISNTQLGHESHGLLYMDLDKFKIVNDTCGHAAGDELLEQISRLMLSKIRSSDSLGRLGGDEFGVLLTSCGEKRAVEIAEAIRQEVNNFVFDWQQHTFRIAISIGVVSVTHNSSCLADLLSSADTACYRAKQFGNKSVYIAECPNLSKNKKAS